MKEVQLTGGARIGGANVTIPFAKLKVNKERLELNASIVGNLHFQPSDVVSIEPYTLIPLFGQGVKINHRVSNYREKVIFWTLSNPASVIKQIEETGFLANKNALPVESSKAIQEQQVRGGFPLKKSAAIIAIIVWNLLFLADVIPFLMGPKPGLPIGKGILTALGLVFLAALLSLISSGFRRLILKEGRRLEDIKRFAIFLLILTGFMFFQFFYIGKFLADGEL